MNELGERVTLFNDDLLGPFDPGGVLMILRRGQPLWERWREDVQSIFHQSLGLRLERA